MAFGKKLQNILKVVQFIILVQVFGLFVGGVAKAQEITAIDFNGGVIGKVIPDGKVVGSDNKLIGNVTADSLILNFEGKLIGGVIPQGVAIGNDARFLGKVNNDGSVRSASGQVLGKVLPNGLVVNDFFDIVGAVIFPGLVYSDEGKTIGRITGDGSYANLQGQKVGVVTPDGYAYREVGSDYILDGRLISSKMVVSLQGDFIGSLAPGGVVSNFESQRIGQVKANGFVYNDENQIVGKVVKSGYAFDNNGYYLGFISYNGEVVNNGEVVGKMRADERIADLSGEIIGYSIDFAASATDLKGKYIGRVLPGGDLSRATTTTALLGARGLIFSADGTILGQVIATGPVFDYKGLLRGHALANGSIISLNGTQIGYLIGSNAFDLSGQMIGMLRENKIVLSSLDDVLGVNGANSKMAVDSKEFLVSSLGYVFSQDGVFSGSSVSIGSLYSPNGLIVSMVGLSGKAVNQRGVGEGSISNSGYMINQQGTLVAKNINDTFAVSGDGKFLGSLNADNLVLDESLSIVAKVLPDSSVVKTNNSTSSNYQPKIGQGYSANLAVDFVGNFLGYANVLGAVNNLAGAKIGQVVENSLIIDNNNIVIGYLLGYKAMINQSCEVSGVVSPSGNLQSFRGIYLGKSLSNGEVISDSGSLLGHLVNQAPLVNFSGQVIGLVSSDGKALDMQKNNLGCVEKTGILRDANGLIIAGAISYGSAKDFNGNIIGYSSINGDIIDDDNMVVGYQQPDGNINAPSGLPIGAIHSYKIAFDLDNNFLGRVLIDGTVVNDKLKNVGKIDFEGYVIADGAKIGYALYDFYVYDTSDNPVGYINRNGDVASFTNQSLGRIEKGFLLNKKQEVIARGNRDYNIRDKNKLVLGRLLFNGDVVDKAQNIIGKLDKTGNIKNINDETIAQAYSLQYYSSLTIKNKLKMIFDKDGNFIGYLDENGNLIDANGKIIGKLDENGNIIDNDGNIIVAAVDQAGREVFDKKGDIIGVVDADNNVIDSSEKIIGRLTENGDAVDANGNIIGGIGNNWYAKAPLKDEIVEAEEDLSPALKLLESKEYRKSLGIALTPDGKYLGDIMDDNSVIDKKGNYLGRLTSDGLVLDDNGSLIGVKEIKKPTSSTEMFIPAGTFGDGGAYGTGDASTENLGPGGGYGPGERYDPARQAALNAAMSERRKNISVGKISNGVRKEAFDGMQKDWEEQGIGKIISSWRVDLSEMIFADKPIPAVISRAIDSNNPAPITAFVERNVYAEEGRNIIIPSGSRLIGTLGGLTASSEATSESARVQISWERLIRPDGSLFVFQGLTADAQGRAGALGYVDQQLFKKYTLPILTTSLSSATAYFMSPDEEENENETPQQQAANDARQNFLNQMSSVFDEVLADKSSVKPMTYIPAGTRIIVFPNTDLWLRTVERDDDPSILLNKPNVFIDDGEKAAERSKSEKEKVATASSAAASGDVVYDASADVESAKAPPPLINSSKPSTKKTSAPSYLTPPPPPSSGSSSSSTAGSGAKSSTSNSNVPALF